MKIVGIGAGGHSKVLIDSLRLAGQKIDFLLDQDSAKKGKKILDVEVLGSDELLKDYPPDTVQLVNCIGSTQLPTLRESVFNKYKKLGYSFASVIHPRAIVSEYAELSEGVQVMAGAIIMASVKINQNVIVNTKASIDHDSEIGEHSHIAPGVTMSGFTRVGKSCHIGTGACFIQSVSVGDQSTVGAGSLVNKDIPGGVQAYGVPARWKSV